jgi:uncharacterized protein YyaL (SSP411 family)
MKYFMKEDDKMPNSDRVPNRLITEKSPYLLQHAYNPVNWFPWSDEAFEKAKSEDKPVFLSIGYSTCHWCHVMERESFEDEEVAEVLNKHFVCIKVDREERPDVDHIYMTVCQALTGHGGWPLSIFMTPDKKPFFAGTYFPKHDRMGMAGFLTLLGRINEAWNRNRSELLESSDRITKAISEPDTYSDEDVPYNTIHEAFRQFKHDFDSIYGGFGSAPKFPTPHNLLFLLRYWHVTKDAVALEMVEKTLDCMYRGGIYDHIGFGFSRYSTDRKWLVPHFEKMLYDNALLAMAYLEAYQATKKEKYAEVAEQIFTYVLRDMTSEEGGFFSAEDADSEGEEGKFYIWAVDEIKNILGDIDGQKYCELYDITQNGNFEGRNIPNLIKSTIDEKDRSFAEKYRIKLFNYREKRVHPYKDDKILTSWNGLMIAAMAIGGRVLGNSRYTGAAESAAKFILSKMLRQDGRLMARYRDGETAYPAYVDDYAFLIWGLIELYETTYKPEYLKKALDLNNDLLKLFWDEENGGLFIYGSDSEQLITRPKEVYDGATPSGNSVSAMNFLRLARLTGRHELEERAIKLFRTFGRNLVAIPRGHAYLMSAFLYSQSPAKEVVLVASQQNAHADDMLEVLKEKYMPFTLSMYYSDNLRTLKGIAPFIADYKVVDGKTTAYVCENFACQAPVTEIEKLREILQH